jgi:hypothetical protein
MSGFQQTERSFALSKSGMNGLKGTYRDGASWHAMARTHQTLKCFTQRVPK